MQRRMLKSGIHLATVTGVDPHDDGDPRRSTVVQGAAR